MNLIGKVAWIAGGARMGGAIARTLSEQGCNVVLTYNRSRKLAQDVVDDIQRRGIESVCFRCDITRPNDIKKTEQDILRRFGRIDILVNLASLYEKGAWDAHMNVNARSAYRLMEIVGARMKRHRWGRIIHVTDWTAASGRPRYKGYGGYYASKATLQAIVESAALELAPDVLVNAIAPGPMLPPKGISKKEYQSVMDATPLRAWGGAEEVAKAVRFLCDTDFVTGETIRVDGGRHLN